MKKIKVAVIGTGEIAKVHISAYLNNNNVELAALVDIDKKKVESAGKRYGVNNCFTSADDLFDEMNVDAVSVCTPPNNHAEIVLKALTCGTHVLCEKPIAMDVDEGRKVVEVSQKYNKILMVGFNRHFHPNYVRAKETILKGSLGHAYLIEDHLLQPSPLFKWGKSPWFYSPGVGGVVDDLGPHVVDMINYLFGDFPLTVTANSLKYLDSPVEECCTLVLKYPHNKIGIALISWLASVNIENIGIHGTAQSLYMTPNLYLEVNATDFTQISLWRNITEELISMKFPKLLKNTNAHRKVNTHKLEIDYFLRHVSLNSTKCSNSTDALKVLITCNAIKKALETNKVIDINV